MTVTIPYYRPRNLRTLMAREDPPPQQPKLSELLKQHPTLQTDLDTVIEERLARERRQNNNRWDPEKEQELERLKTAEKDRERKDQEAKGNYDRALASVNEEHTTEKSKWSKRESDLLNEIKHDRCYSQLVIEATAAGAVSPEAIAKLLGDRLTLDDDRKVVVLGEDGKAWLKAGRNVTVKELVDRHKHDMPWAYKADGGEGSGAGGTGTDSADKGGGDSLDAEIEKAKKDHEDAQAKARRSGSPVDVAASKAARRTLEALEEKKKKKSTAA